MQGLPRGRLKTYGWDHGPKAEIQRRLDDPKHHPEDDILFESWAKSSFINNELMRYKAGYANYLASVESQLLRALPDATVTIVSNPANPQSLGEITGVCGDLKDLTDLYQTKLMDEGKIPKPQR